MPPDTEAVAEQAFTALADPTPRAILAAAPPGRRAPGGPGHRHRSGRTPADHPAGGRQAPGPAGRGRPGDGRAGRAAPGPLPAALGSDAGRPAVPGRPGP